jgi:hypothetical protein
MIDYLISPPLFMKKDSYPKATSKTIMIINPAIAATVARSISLSC